jgi:hypothetical protein
VNHRNNINTGTALPIRQPIRRLPFGKREIEKEKVNKMLTMGVIEPSSSPWSSLVVLVKKKDGSTRFCVDYRKLNDVRTVSLVGTIGFKVFHDVMCPASVETGDITVD